MKIAALILSILILSCSQQNAISDGIYVVSYHKSNQTQDSLRYQGRSYFIKNENLLNFETISNWKLIDGQTIDISLDHIGRREFLELTSNNVGREVAVVLNNEIFFVVVINAPIQLGKFQVPLPQHYIQSKQLNIIKKRLDDYASTPSTKRYQKLLEKDLSNAPGTISFFDFLLSFNSTFINHYMGTTKIHVKENPLLMSNSITLTPIKSLEKDVWTFGLHLIDSTNKAPNKFYYYTFSPNSEEFKRKIAWYQSNLDAINIIDSIFQPSDPCYSLPNGEKLVSCYFRSALDWIKHHHSLQQYPKLLIISDKNSPIKHIKQTSKMIKNIGVTPHLALSMKKQTVFFNNENIHYTVNNSPSQPIQTSINSIIRAC